MPSPSELAEFQYAATRPPELLDLLPELTQRITALASALETGLRKEHSCRRYRQRLPRALDEAKRIVGVTRTLPHGIERSRK
jgi:two-component sensor histidine kinase